MFPSRTRGLLTRQNEANLPDTCEVQEMVEERQPGGVTKMIPKVLRSGVPCYLFPASRERLQEYPEAGGLAERARWGVRLPAGTSVPLGGRLVVTVGEERSPFFIAGEEVTIEVGAVLGPRSEESTRIVVGEKTG